MKVVLVYDSLYGNTARVAKVIEGVLMKNAEMISISPADAVNLLFDDVDLLVVLSPTQGGRPMQSIQDFIDGLPDLPDVYVAVADTRFAEKGHGIGLRLLMKTVGYAAEKMSESLLAKDAKLIVPEEGFIIENKKGPLREGELERAAEWAKAIRVRIEKLQ